MEIESLNQSDVKIREEKNKRIVRIHVIFLLLLLLFILRRFSKPYAP
jgi:hypothetical protein